MPRSSSPSSPALARTPDHGKLFPWRFVVLGPQSRADIAARLAVLVELRNGPAKDQAVLAKLTAAPVTILVVSTPVEGSKPIWEQHLSAGAVCMNLVVAANAAGYASAWLTEWFAYDRRVLDALGLDPAERIAGFIHIGRPREVPSDRPRPDLDQIVTRL